MQELRSPCALLPSQSTDPELSSSSPVVHVHQTWSEPRLCGRPPIHVQYNISSLQLAPPTCVHPTPLQRTRRLIGAVLPSTCDTKRQKRGTDMRSYREGCLTDSAQHQHRPQACDGGLPPCPPVPTPAQEEKKKRNLDLSGTSPQFPPDLRPTKTHPAGGPQLQVHRLACDATVKATRTRRARFVVRCNAPKRLKRPLVTRGRCFAGKTDVCRVRLGGRVSLVAPECGLAWAVDSAISSTYGPDVQQMQHQSALLRVECFLWWGGYLCSFFLQRLTLDYSVWKQEYRAATHKHAGGYRGRVSGNPPSPNPS